MSDSIPMTTVELPYARTLGAVHRRFFTGLRDGEIWANKTATGKVQCPPFEYDPDNGAGATDEWVQLDGTGTVSTWAWVAEPLRNNALQEPFAWCLIRLDGADTDLLAPLRADRERVATGMRVKAQWRDERIGHINDMFFEPA